MPSVCTRWKSGNKVWLLLAGLCGAAQAQDWPTLTLYFSQQENALSQAYFPITRANGFAAQQQTLALTLDGEHAGFTWRVRALAARAGGNPAQQEVRLKELNKVWRLNQDCKLSLGKRILAWDVGFLLQPLGFFQTQPNLSDLQDLAGNSEGLPLALLSCRVAQGLALDLAHSRDSAPLDYGNRGLRQTVLRLSGQQGQLSYALLARQVREVGHGVGASLSYTPLESLEAHASLYWQRGQRSWRHAGLQTADQFWFSNPYQEQRSESWRGQSLLGLNWTPRDWPALTLEWSHNGNGMQRDEWRRWRQMVDWHRSAPGPQALREVNLLWDAQSLPPQGMLRDYAYLQWQGAHAGWDWSLGQSFGLQDGSRAAFLNLRRGLWRGASIGFSISHFARKGGTEYAYLPYTTSLGLRFAGIF
ncbi:hypothetical protein V8J88_20925 [Massilia sp. W12]|uniref:hypothetical protein n=1 Tax=Massilia sp. W12 TaxID=3126507 RepID=UPI0030D12B7D